MKKILTLILALALILSSCLTLNAGAENAETLEPVTLRWVANGPDKQRDHDEVLAKFNEELQAYLPNTTLVLESYSDLGDRWPMMLSAEETIDIAWTGYAFNVLNEILKEAYLPLDDLIAQYAPAIQEEMGIWEADFGTMRWDGQLYGIPNHQPAIKETSFFSVPEELLEYFDYEGFLNLCHSEKTVTAEMLDYIDAYLAKIYELNLPGTGTIGQWFDPSVVCSYLVGMRFEGLGGNDQGTIGYWPFSDEIKITSLYESDEYKLYLDYASKWFKAGYVRKDILTADTSSSTGSAVLGGHNTNNWNGIVDPIGLKKVPAPNETSSNTVSLLLDAPENKWQGALKMGSTATYTAIPYTAENPERAMMLLNLIRSDEGKALYNMLCFGIEGKHYEFTTDDNHISCFDYPTAGQGNSSCSYSQHKWVIGNVYKAYETPEQLEGQMDYCLNFQKNIKSQWYKTPVFGMVIDNSDIDVELTQVAAVFSEYTKQLNYGLLEDWKPTYDEMMSKAYAAGLQKIIDAYQAQCDAFIAAK